MSSPHFNGDADENLVTVEGASGIVHFVTVYNSDASDTVFLQIFASADAVVGTDPPQLSLPCDPGSSGFYLDSCVLGGGSVNYAVTATANGAGAPPSTVSVSLGFS